VEKIFNHPIYILFVFIVVMPVNGLIASMGGSWILFGVALICMQIPWILGIVSKLRSN